MNGIHCDRLEYWVITQFNDSAQYTIFNGLTAHLLKRIELMRFRGTQRQKGGLLDFVGQAASWLFGTATEQDIKSLQETDRLLASAVEGVVRTQQKVVAKVIQIGKT